MKWFGRGAGRAEARPALSASVARSGVPMTGSVGAWPGGYDAQVRSAYGGNAVAQRAVKLVAEAVGEAPLTGTAEVAALAGARTNGQPLLATAAAQLLLHGNAYLQVLRDADGGAAELFALRPERVAEDRLSVSRATWLAGEAASVPLLEVRESFA